MFVQRTSTNVFIQLRCGKAFSSVAILKGERHPHDGPSWSHGKSLERELMTF